MHALLLSTLVLAADPSAIDTGHHVEIAGDTVVVHTEWIPDGYDHGGDFTLAWPLPDATVDGVEGHLDDGGALQTITVVELPVTFELRMPLKAAQQLGAVPLPIPDRSGTHRITFDPGASYDPDVDLGFAPRLTRAMTANVESGNDRWLDARLSSFPPGGGVIRYATTRDLKAVGGLAGHLETTQTRRQRLLLLAGAAFLAVVAALAAAHRRLRRAAESERADKLLAEEFDALDPSR